MSFIHLMWSSYGHGFSQQLRRVRKRRGISQQALAEISGVSRSQISNLERNENGVHAMADPQLSTVYKLALALEIPPTVLLPAGGDVVEGHLTDSAVAAAEDVAPFPQGYVDRRRFAATWNGALS
ncbi:helix-turn-helix domain-containing protein [Corynebacterium marquesiae]|uniref:helix-turn-helix domain-containing protein n=1 Tax=Corynebacterium marquesiae TaxID=2913503 RepID=UPI0032EFCC39